MEKRDLVEIRAEGRVQEVVADPKAPAIRNLGEEEEQEQAI